MAGVDLVPLDHPGVDNLIADITDSGQMFNAMSAYAGFDELEAGTGVPAFDAVVHFAAVPRILLQPDNETFRVNTIGTYNVIEAAVKLGIEKIIIASSETTYGICFSDGKTDPQVLPLEEDYDVDPMDSYGLSKVVNEKTARSFQRRSGFDIYALRIGNVIEPHEYAELFPGYFEKPEVRRRNAFCYIDCIFQPFPIIAIAHRITTILCFNVHPFIDPIIATSIICRIIIVVRNSFSPIVIIFEFYHTWDFLWYACKVWGLSRRRKTDPIGIRTSSDIS